MMKENQPSYRLHKRAAQDCCAGGEDEGKDDRMEYLMKKRLRNKLSTSNLSRDRNYFPALSTFRPAYYSLGGILEKVDKVGK